MRNGADLRMGLAEMFGQIDIYVFDQLLRGNIAPGMRVLDAGCGSGRNLVYLLCAGYEVYGLDAQAEAVTYVQGIAAALQPALPAGNFRVGAIEAMPFADSSMDVALCNAVLHFARDDEQFSAMVQAMWRVLRPGGLMFCRLGSRIGMEFPQVTGRRYMVGAGHEWFLVDEAMLMEWTAKLDAELVDPLKTTVVQGARCMTTWVLRKRR